MTKITFTSQNVMSDQLANRTGNLSKKLYDMDNSLAGNKSIPIGLGSDISQTNPYGGGIPENSVPSAFGFDSEENDGQLRAYLNQVNLSSYYQQNPDVVLGPSAKYSQGQGPMGGPSSMGPSSMGSSSMGSSLVVPPLKRKVEHFTDDAYENMVLEEDVEESPMEQFLYLIGTGIALTSLIGISVALSISEN